MRVPYVLYRNPEKGYHADFPCVAAAANGDVLVLLRHCGAWARQATFTYGRPLSFFETEAEICLLRSADGGGSFDACVLFRGLAFDPMLCTLPDGRLMAGVVLGEAGSRHERASLRGVLHRHLPQLDTVITVRGVQLCFSKDSGATWGDPSFVAEDAAGRAHYAAGVGYWQPAMCALPAGELVCVCVLDEQSAARPRDAGAPAGTLSRLMRTRSTDSGFTWSMPQATGLSGDYPSLIVLSDERLLLTHTERGAACAAVLAHVSADQGVSWQLVSVLLQESDWQFHYPHTAQLPDGALFSVWMATQPDGVRVVQGVRWELT